jgi:predicted regulator of Ras-like GTPase activity (Roadblock/LC7/MglB family)
MTKKKRSPSETVTTVLLDGETEENPDTADLRARLEEIRSLGTVKGYILRDSASAVIDFEDSDKTAEYAMLSSQAFESYEEFRELFKLSDIENMLIACTDLNMLCVAIGEVTVSVFIEKDADSAEVLAKLKS